MEAFSLLKYWRNSGVAAVTGAPADARNGTTTRTKTILTAVSHHDTDTDDDGDGDGPFFDLELALPEEEDDGDGNEGTKHEDEAMESDGEIEREIKLTASPVSTGDCTESDEKAEVSSSKSAAAASKFRVLLLKLKKSIPKNAADQSDPNTTQNQPPEKRETKRKSSSFTLKFKIEEVFARGGNKSSSDESVAAEEKRFSKEAIEKYLKKVKPLYVRVSKRYVEKIRFSGQLDTPSPSAKSAAVGSEKEPDVPSEPSPPAIRTARSQKRGSFPAGLRVVCKHLGKSRSASSAAAPPVQAKRGDDSFLQQQDGIQSAILHCKRSFNSSSADEAESEESSVLWRSASDSSSSNEKSSGGSEGGVAKETSN